MKIPIGRPEYFDSLNHHSLNVGKWRILPCLLLTIFNLLYGVNQCRASHASGSDIRYRCLGGLVYEVEVSFYRDCGGVSEPSSIVINCYSASAGFSQNISAPKINDPNNGMEITYPCPASPTQCSGGITGGIRRWRYKGVITLPSPRSDWTFGYSICCRNCAITTISNPCSANSTLYVEATLNNLTAACNNSPTFSNFPIAHVCVGQLYHYNHGVYDAEGDSLTYSLITPKTSRVSNVNFLSPYSVNYPIASSTPFSIDNQSGDISFTPLIVQTGVLAIRVNEYRNGQLIGSVIRDMQIYSQICNNQLPLTSGINNSSNYTASVCPGQNLCFQIQSFDADSSQYLSMVTDSGITGGQYSITPGHRPTLNFCWTPTPADALETQPKKFNITVKDDACPYNGVQTFSYSVYVQGPLFSFQKSEISCAGASDGGIQINPIDSNNYNYLWNTGATSRSIQGISAGNYTATITNSSTGCQSSGSIKIEDPAPLEITINATQPSCQTAFNGSIGLSVTGGSLPYDYQWSNGGNTPSLTQLGNGSYSVSITDMNSCNIDTIIILNTVSNLQAISSVVNNHCYNDSTASISVFPINGVAPYNYIWSNGQTTNTIGSLANGSYTVTISDSANCFTDLTLQVSGPDNPLSASAIIEHVKCQGAAEGSIAVTPEGGTPPYTISWQDGGAGDLRNGLTKGIYTALITDSLQCHHQVSMEIEEPESSIMIDLSSTNIPCNPSSTGTIHADINGGTSPYILVWNNGADQPDIQTRIPGMYSLIVIDAEGCLASDSILIERNENNLQLLMNPEPANCILNTPGRANIYVNGGIPPYKFKWSNGDTLMNPDLVPGPYIAEVTDAAGCSKNINIQIDYIAPIELYSSTGNTLCAGQGTVLSCNIPDEYPMTWYYNGQAIKGAFKPDFTTRASGTYYVRVKTPCGEFESKPIEIRLLSANQISINNSVIICNGESTQLNAGGGVSYKWYPEDGLSDPESPNPISSPTKNTEYTVSITDENGCTYLASVLVTVMCDTLNIPNGFSPNGDGINDVFTIEGIEKYEENVIFIYNRWGNLVFKQRNYQNTWNGRSNIEQTPFGEELLPGTYYYILDLKNGQKPIQGFVVLKK